MVGYSNDEIIGLYKEAKNKTAQLQILQDLTCRPLSEIIAVLHGAGLAQELGPDGKPKDKAAGTRTDYFYGHSEEVWREIIRLRLEGLSAKETAERVGINRKHIDHWRYNAKALGIPIPEKVERQKKEDKTLEKKEQSALRTAVMAAVDAFEAADHSLTGTGSFSVELSENVLAVNYVVELKETE